MPRSDRSFARRFNPSYHSPYNRAARGAYTRSWFRLAGRVAGGAGAVAAAGLANLFAQVPRLSSDTRVNMPSRMIPFMKRKAEQQLLPAYRAPKARGNAEQDAGGYIQTKYSKDKVGKKLDKVQRMMKMLAAQVSYRVDRFGALTDTTSNDGFYDLNSYISGGAGSRVTALPVYALDLTAQNQKDYVTAATNCPAIFSRLNFFEATDDFRWTQITGLIGQTRDAAPLLTYGWEPILGANPVALGGEPSDNVANGFIGNVKIGMVITGARKFATTVWVQLVQFTDENLGPQQFGSPNVGGFSAPAVPTAIETASTDIQEAATHKKFWLEQTQGLLENPLNRKVTGRTPGMKVLYSKRFNYNPTLTTENDAGGHESVFKLNYNMDKVVNYQVKPDNTQINDLDLAEVNAIQQVSTNKSLYVNTVRKGRVYLLIKAGVPAVAASDPGVTTYDNYPTFDLQVNRVMHRLRAEAVTF